MFSSTVTVVTSLIDVVNSLFDPRNRPPRGRAMQRLGDGMVHVEYPEDDYVYLVTVQQVPRTVLPLERPIAVGEPKGMPVQLIQVAVANHVEVTLDAAPAPPATRRWPPSGRATAGGSGMTIRADRRHGRPNSSARSP